MDCGKARLLPGGNHRTARTTTNLGSGTVPFERIDGVAENFHTTQNRELLEKLAVRNRRTLLDSRTN